MTWPEALHSDLFVVAYTNPLKAVAIVGAVLLVGLIASPFSERWSGVSSEEKAGQEDLAQAIFF